jgi:S-adenosyl methyltransferase
VIAVNPNVLPGVRANRAFLGRAVRYLTREAGIRQFLDLGTGLPTAENTHQVAQAIAPDARVVYDPWGIVARLLDALAPGSYLTVSDTVRDIDTGRVTEGTARLNERMGPTRLTLRSRPEFERFFSGLELAEPGVVPLPEWRGAGSEYPIPCYAGMGRKPH